MNELAMQQLIIDAVEEKGGFARKLSNRFMVGVVDLLIKQPIDPAGLLEVKRYDFSGQQASSVEFKLDVTGPQKRFLTAAHSAGMPCGVASFMQRKAQGVRGLSLAIYNLPSIEARGFMAKPAEHRVLGGPETRSVYIRQEVVDWLERWRRLHG